MFTDGVPNHPVAAELILNDAVNSVTSTTQLTFLVVPVGCDVDTTKWFKQIEDKLKTVKFGSIKPKTHYEEDNIHL